MTYYRRKYGYQETGWADDPDEIHREFHRITDAFSSIDQNSVGVGDVRADYLCNATNPEHEGLTDFRAEYSSIVPRDDPRSGSFGVTIDPGVQGPVSYFSAPNPFLGPPGKLWQIEDVQRNHKQEGSDGRWFALREESASLVGQPQYGMDLLMRVNPSSEGPWLVAAAVGFKHYTAALATGTTNTMLPWRTICEFRIAASTGQTVPGRGVVTLGNDYRTTSLREANPLLVSTIILPPGPCDLRIEYRITWAGSGPSDTNPDMRVNNAAMFAVGLLK